MLYKIAICDNDKIWLKKTENIINEYFLKSHNQVYIDMYENSESFLQTDMNYDLLFLAIKMPGINGLELKDRLANYNLKIIFVTSFKEHMEEAFGRNVLAYIAKDELYKITNVLCKIEKNEQSFQMIEIAGKTICVKDILYLEGEGSYTKVNMISGDKILFSISLNKLLNKLQSNKIVRTHKTYAVNMQYVVTYNYKNVMLQNKIHVALSRSHVKEFRENYHQHLKD